MTQDTSGDLARRAFIFGALGAALPRRASARSKVVGGHSHATMAMVPTRQQDEIEETPAGRLGNPWTAGQPRARPTKYDNDPFVVELEQRLKCNCGCAHSLYACRTTDFSCQFWQPLHAEVIEMVKQEMTAEEIIDAYVTKYGTQYLMAPPAEGFNVAGYIVPGILISIVAAGMVWILQRKMRGATVPAAVTQSEPSASAGLSEADEAKLAEELNKLRP